MHYAAPTSLKAALEALADGAGTCVAGGTDLWVQKDEPGKEVGTRLVNIMRQHYPGIAIHARGRDRQHCDQLLKAGATLAISETLESSLQLGQGVLLAMGNLEDHAVALIRQFRDDYYG